MNPNERWQIRQINVNLSPAVRWQWRILSSTYHYATKRSCDIHLKKKKKELASFRSYRVKNVNNTGFWTVQRNHCKFSSHDFIISPNQTSLSQYHLSWKLSIIFCPFFPSYLSINIMTIIHWFVELQTSFIFMRSYRKLVGFFTAEIDGALVLLHMIDMWSLIIGCPCSLDCDNMQSIFCYIFISYEVHRPEM